MSKKRGPSLTTQANHQLKKRTHLKRDDETIDAWPKSGLPDPDELYLQLTKGLPVGTEVTIRLHDDGKLDRIKFFHGKEDSYFFFNREFTARGTVIHNGAKVTEDLCNKGIAKTANRNLFEFYDRMHIGKARVDAGLMGVYVWARMGFVPDLGDWVRIRREIAGRIDYLKDHPAPDAPVLPAHYIQKLQDIVKQDDPKAYWLIVDQKLPCYGTTIGKLLTLPFENQPQLFRQQDRRGYGGMLPISWMGNLDMNDPDCLARRNAYLYGDDRPSQGLHMRAPS